MSVRSTVGIAAEDSVPIGRLKGGVALQSTWSIVR